MKFDKRTNRALFLFLVGLNFSLRYFLMGNHEEGSDSFLIHNLSNTITEFGLAKWSSSYRQDDSCLLTTNPNKEEVNTVVELDQ